MSDSTKALLTSWAGTFVAAVLTALIAVFGDGELSWDDLKYVAVAGVMSVLPVIRNYFDTNYSGYGKVGE